MNSRHTDPASAGWRRVLRRERRSVLAAAAVTVTAVSLVAIGAATHSGEPPEVVGSGTVAGSTPIDTKLYTDPDLLAIEAAREDPRLDPIAQTPQAKWFSDWSTSATVIDDVGDYLAAAEAANAVPTIVLYRIPALDCGSAVPAEERVYTGARDEQEYKDWVDGAAAALMGHDEAMVILEPDALPHLGECEQGDRQGMLRYAVDTLSTTGARVYIDAGHQNWLSPAEAANRLKGVDVDKVTGFSLNVSNYQTTGGEVRYAERVRSALRALGVTDAHYVIDISRNGAGPQDNYCNAPGARLGASPRLFEGAGLDGLLWVKNPGETDGMCQGGPKIGFWIDGALRLLGLEGS
ncbi:glycoside hydrolase family 6 protein [Mycobacterium sp. 236(2023)]|uniref:glycoside hydrolase family 6 protein n=1 Tax=Mycobacterium sp. 236(2023) TaxID=3038163 RepID=UPI0024158403|nr:glycoside hydrolase family 6 protein [Mycobacterium sp. 236(2023)]MDG4665374.1 glycoside hydrolase family 6 protein [Mycobacterium sp. 236(2023)]